jgi:hypothetical protein
VFSRSENAYATLRGLGAVILPANGPRRGTPDSGRDQHPTLDGATSYDEMVTRIAGGDEGALAELYDRICPQVLGLVQRFRGDDEQVEDLVYGIFLEIWRTAPLFDATNTTAAAWILHLAHLRATAVIDGDGEGTVSIGDPGACTHAALPPAQVPVSAGAPHGTNLSRPEGWDQIVRNFLAH